MPDHSPQMVFFFFFDTNLNFKTQNKIHGHSDAIDLNHT